MIPTANRARSERERAADVGPIDRAIDGWTAERTVGRSVGRSIGGSPGEVANPGMVDRLSRSLIPEEGNHEPRIYFIRFSDFQLVPDWRLGATWNAFTPISHSCEIYSSTTRSSEG